VGHVVSWSESIPSLHRGADSESRGEGVSAGPDDMQKCCSEYGSGLDQIGSRCSLRALTALIKNGTKAQGAGGDIVTGTIQLHTAKSSSSSNSLGTDTTEIFFVKGQTEKKR